MCERDGVIRTETLLPRGRHQAGVECRGVRFHARNTLVEIAPDLQHYVSVIIIMRDSRGDALSEAERSNRIVDYRYSQALYGGYYVEIA